MTKTILTALSALIISAGAVSAAGGDNFPTYESGVTAVVNQEEASIDPGTTASISGAGQGEAQHGDPQLDNVTVQAPEVRKWGR
ncbi:MAG: hypothetical protein WA973_12905 [Mesorhizobium sp.]